MLNIHLRWFLEYNLRYPPIVYRFRDAALVEIFFDDPFLFRKGNFSRPPFVKNAMKQRVKVSHENNHFLQKKSTMTCSQAHRALK